MSASQDSVAYMEQFLKEFFKLTSRRSKDQTLNWQKSVLDNSKLIFYYL